MSLFDSVANLAFLSLQSSAGSMSSIRLASCGGVKTSSLLRFARIGQPEVVSQRIFSHRFGKENLLAEIGKKGRLPGAGEREQLMKREVPALYHATLHERPFAKRDGLRIVAHGLERERIAPNNIAAQDVFDGTQALVAKKGSKAPFENVEKPFSALQNIIFQNVYPVDRAYGHHRIALLLRRAFAVPALDNVQLSLEDFGQEIAVAAGRLQEAGIDALRFLLHEVEHGIDFARAGQDLAVLFNTRLGDDLLFPERRNLHVAASTKETVRLLELCSVYMVGALRTAGNREKDAEPAGSFALRQRRPPVCTQTGRVEAWRAFNGFGRKHRELL